MKKVIFFALLVLMIAGCSKAPQRNTEGEEAMSLDEVQKIAEDEDTEAQSPASGEINGHDYVDLGLSVKWATCNIGAEKPSDYGDYFAWGEIEPKSEYTIENSKTYGKKMRSIAGNPKYDAARANWGGTWRLPTFDEISEIITKCKHKWTTLKGHKGYKVIGPNGNSIFLPAAGWYDDDDTSLRYAGEGGGYLCGRPDDEYTSRANTITFYSDCFIWGWCHRSDGQSVRPVTK